MIKRPTLLMLFVLVLVIGTFFFVKSHPPKSLTPTPTALGNRYLVTQSDGTLIKLWIEDNLDKIVQLQRDPSQVWIVVQPTPGPADQGLAGAAETQVGALRIVTQLEPPPSLSDMGLDVPSLIITLWFDNGMQHKLEVGNLTPTDSGYYVRFDNNTVYVISQSGIDSLKNLLSAPPYPPTETPTKTETEQIQTNTHNIETLTPTP
jgi:hypothetical protein